MLLYYRTRRILAEQVLVTGSSGLIGSAVVRYLDKLGYRTIGIDNNNRKLFFGIDGDTSKNLELLKSQTQNFISHNVDISDEISVNEIFQKYKFDSIVHCAAQPSHDKAALIPKLDFFTNAVGTFYLLEGFRNNQCAGSFIFLSTNKVYGDNPNNLSLKESELRMDFKDPDFENGINESMSIDNTTHSLFGASKVSADILVQEYGKYFDLNTVALRGGCLTGIEHASVPLHGFLSYLVRTAVTGGTYNIIGYKGKQVRDQIHSWDVANIVFNLMGKPLKGEVFNIGGGKSNSMSILEIIKLLSDRYDLNLQTNYIPENRKGDHICYYTDLRKLKNQIDDFHLNYDMGYIVDELVFNFKK